MSHLLWCSLCEIKFASDLQFKPVTVYRFITHSFFVRGEKCKGLACISIWYKRKHDARQFRGSLNNIRPALNVELQTIWSFPLQIPFSIMTPVGCQAKVEVSVVPVLYHTRCWGNEYKDVVKEGSPATISFISCEFMSHGHTQCFIHSHNCHMHHCFALRTYRVICAVE